MNRLVELASSIKKSRYAREDDEKSYLTINFKKKINKVISLNSTNTNFYETSPDKIKLLMLKSKKRK